MTLTANKSRVTLLKSKEHLEFVVAPGPLHLQCPLQGMPFSQSVLRTSSFSPFKPTSKGAYLALLTNQSTADPSWLFPSCHPIIFV